MIWNAYIEFRIEFTRMWNIQARRVSIMIGA